MVPRPGRRRELQGGWERRCPENDQMTRKREWRLNPWVFRVFLLGVPKRVLNDGPRFLCPGDSTERGQWLEVQRRKTLKCCKNFNGARQIQILRSKHENLQARLENLARSKLAHNSVLILTSPFEGMFAALKRQPPPPPRAWSNHNQQDQHTLLWQTILLVHLNIE